MLLELKVSDFAIIDQVNISFGRGFNVISGETGAGKSVLLKSLSLLMGAKAAVEDIRTGAKKAQIEGLFDLNSRPDIQARLENLDIETEEGQLLVRRVLNQNGKSRVYINGTMTPLSTLRELIAPLIELTGKNAPLIEMTGQHENRHLQSKTYHLNLLDAFAGNFTIRGEFKQNLNELHKLQDQLKTLITQNQQREQQLDFLNYQKNEIASLKLQSGEEVEIANKINRLKNISKLQDFAHRAERDLYSDDSSIQSVLTQILYDGESLTKLDTSLKEKLSPIQTLLATIEDLTYELREYGSSLEGDDEDLEYLEEQYSHFKKLSKKYGNSVEEILSTLQGIEAELFTLENYDVQIENLKRDIKASLKKCTELAEHLHKKRVQAAKLLSKEVNHELIDLNMKGLKFLIHIKKLEEFEKSGTTQIEFMIQTAKQDLPKALVKYASGGELSRILLALKNIIGASEYPRTYLFDEVDTGVSGETAEKVGRKLKSIAKGQQVICVTHLPQVAAFADSHYFIEKSKINEKAVMSLRSLQKQEVVQEVARLISGETITKSSLEHAKELLRECHQQ